MVQDGDSRFIGLDMRRDPASVAEGYYTIGEHVSCDDGTVKTRNGNIVVPWGDTYQYTQPYTLRPVERHEGIIDAIRFADTVSLRDYIMLATATEAVLCLPGTTALTIAYPVNYTAVDGARLIQAYDKVFLFNGKNARPLVWDGDKTSSFVFADSADATVTDLGGSFSKPPKTTVACYHKNRIWAKGDDANQVFPSDILDYTSFYVGNEFYVNQGDSDTIKALVPYTNDRIIAFKNNSIYSLDNLTGDLSSASISLISNNIGIVSDRSAQVLGPNMIWLDRRGVMMAQLVQEQRLTPDTIPLSEPIEPIIRRINWGYAHKAVSIIHNDRYMLSVPLDDNTSNSAVLIYNFKNQAWESIDPYTPANAADVGDSYNDSFAPQQMVTVEFGGKQILVTTTLAGCLALYRANEGKADRMCESTTDLAQWLVDEGTVGSASNNKIITTTFNFDSIVQTRGYLGGDPTAKKGFHIDLTIDTFNPSFDLDMVSAGPGESESILTNKTRDRTKRRDYANSATTTAIDNASNEHTNPYLDDYSIHLYSSLNSQTSSAYPQFYFGNGSTVDDVYLFRPQEFNERFRVYKRARAPRVKLTNSEGSLTLKSVSIKEYTRNRNHRREV